MRIWIDLANSPHVPFFKALIPEFIARGNDLEVTARDFAETVPLAKHAGIDATVIGEHGGKLLRGKATNLVARARQLRTWAKLRRFDLAVSHNSYSQIVAARSLGIRSVTLMDYEHQPANHLAFRLANRVIVPLAYPAADVKRFGAARKIKRYDGTKEDVYLADFVRDPNFMEELSALGVAASDVLVVVRPPALEALYHRFENDLFDRLLEWLSKRANVKVLLLPRNDAQRLRYNEFSNLVVPENPLAGSDLIAASDLIVSAGGTMNREAAALGVPAATIYAGRWAAIDEELCRSGRLIRIANANDFEKLATVKKNAAQPRRRLGVKTEVVELILEELRDASR
jgi:predicted glycosyltransferase